MCPAYLPKKTWHTIARFTGRGDTNTARFTIGGKGNWVLRYSYDCSAQPFGFGNFFVDEDAMNTDNPSAVALSVAALAGMAHGTSTATPAAITWQSKQNAHAQCPWSTNTEPNRTPPEVQKPDAPARPGRATRRRRTGSWCGARSSTSLRRSRSSPRHSRRRPWRRRSSRHTGPCWPRTRRGRVGDAACDGWRGRRVEPPAAGEPRQAAGAHEAAAPPHPGRGPPGNAGSGSPRR